MKNSNRGKSEVEKPAVTVGIDLGDRFSHYCVVNQDGEVIEEGRIATTTAAMERHFGGELKMRIALKCGTHSPVGKSILARFGARSMGSEYAEDPGDHGQ